MKLSLLTKNMPTCEATGTSKCGFDRRDCAAVDVMANHSGLFHHHQQLAASPSCSGLSNRGELAVNVYAGSVVARRAFQPTNLGK